MEVLDETSTGTAGGAEMGPGAGADAVRAGQAQDAAGAGQGRGGLPRPLLEVRGLTKAYGGREVLHGSTFDVNEGEFLSILGPSGCGKTTTLRLLIGLEAPTSGTIAMDGADITSLPPARRGMGVVFQDYALFENMTVLGNVTYPLRFKEGFSGDRERVARDMLARLGLADQLDKHVGELSGGQQQRVSIARTLALEPRVILFDEPMSALDVETRLALRADLKDIQRRLGTTMVYITHDQEEAFALSDRIMCMGEGKIHQVGTPEQILRTPATDFVRSFVVENLSRKMASLGRFMDLVR